MPIRRAGVVLLTVVLGAGWMLAGCGESRDREAGPRPGPIAVGPESGPEAPDPNVSTVDPGVEPIPDETTPVPLEAPPHVVTPLPISDEPPPESFDPVTAPPESPPKLIRPKSFATRSVDRSVGVHPLRPEASVEPVEMPLEPRMLEFQPGARQPEPENLLAPPEATGPALSASPPGLEEIPVEPDQPGSDGVDRTDPLTAAKSQGNYQVVKVFYGTDRAAVNSVAAADSPVADWLVALLCSAGIAMILAALGFRFCRGRLTRALAALAVLATVVVGVLTAYSGLHRDFLATEAKPEKPGYGGERGQLTMGTCEVSIPRNHQPGELEGPSILRFEFRQDPQRHVVLLDVNPLSEDAFQAGLKARVQQSVDKDAVVFVHGFNFTFEDAARRTAQMAYDLRFDGAPIFYSWPSQGGLFDYTVDENNARWTVPNLKRFLERIARQSGAEQVHLIAHSMGNRALTAALRDLSFEPDETRPKFNEVVLTAPDIDAEVFKNDIAPRIVKTAERVTLYASSNDKALLSSKKIHGYPRAGDSGPDLIVMPGIDTIDVSAVDTSLLGHSYYGGNETVLADLFDLLHEAKPPDQRKWLRPERLGAMTYWSFRRR